MPKRRANGEGNIRKRKDGRWEGRYTAGYDANGKAITKNVLGRTQAEVKDKLRTAIEDSKKLDPVKAGSYTLEQWLKLWYSVYVEPQVRYSTKEFYHNAIDHHIIPKLGSVKLEKLTMLQIQQFYNELLKSGRVQKKNQPELKEHGLSPRMVQCVHVVLNKALEHAVEEKLILSKSGEEMQNSEKYSQGNEHPAGSVDRPIFECSERAWHSRTDVSGTDHRLTARRAAGLTVGGLGRSEPHVVHQQKRCAAEWKAGHQHTENAKFHPNSPTAGRHGKTSRRGARKTSCESVFVPVTAYRERHGIRTGSAGFTTGSSKKSARNMCVFMTCGTHLQPYR